MRHSFKYRKYLKDMRYALMRRILLFVLAKRRVNILAQLSEMIETKQFQCCEEDFGEGEEELKRRTEELKKAKRQTFKKGLIQN